MAAVADPEQQLAWEARQRPRAGIAAIAAGVLTLVGFLWVGVAFQRRAARRLPRVARPGVRSRAPIGDQPSLRTPEFQFYEDHAFTFDRLVGRARARAARRSPRRSRSWPSRRAPAGPSSRAPVVYVALVGAVLLAIASVLGGWRTVIGGLGTSSTGPRRSTRRARSATTRCCSRPTSSTSSVRSRSRRGLFLVSLNAMRVGLLTRFLGILGIISGVAHGGAAVVPLPVVQSFWLITVGLLMLGVAPGAARRRGAPATRSRGRAAPRRGMAPPPAPSAPANGDGEGEPFPPAARTRRRRSASASAAASRFGCALRRPRRSAASRS